MITNSPRNAILLASHDLRVAKERISSFIHLIRLSGVLAALSSQLGTRAVPEYETINRYVALYTCFLPLIPYSPDTHTRVEVGGSFVKKTFMKPDSAEHVSFLTGIYWLLRRKKVPYTDFLLTASFEPQNSTITTSPVGLTQWPDDGYDGYNALHCVLEALKVLALPIS